MVSYLRKKGIIPGELLNSFAPALLPELGFSNDSAIVVARYYMNGSAGNWAGDLLMDVLVVCPVRHFADYLDEAGNSVHRYLLLRRRRTSSDNASTADGEWGDNSAPRLYALGLVFGEPLRHPDGDAEEQALSRRMIALWTEFAKRGTITTDVGESIFNYTIAISKTDGSTFQFRKSQCDFLKNHYL
ncbi:acetylcholinesterase-like [Amblyomma americanum]